jgi:hydroxyethylthiazole kinase-like uncharacterized protein yjeF
MLDYEDIAVLDRNSLYLGVPTFELMEHAGAGIAKVVQEHENLTDKPVLIFCGLGNNGGDGLVAARYLAQDIQCRVRLVLLGAPYNIKSTIASEQFYRLPKSVEVITIENSKDDVIQGLDISNYTVIIDAMLGVGITGTLKKPYSSVVELINSIPRGLEKDKKLKSSKSSTHPIPLIVAVDVPTGLGTDMALKPDITVTFHDSKRGMTPQNSGEIIIHDIGIPADAEIYVGPGELIYIPKLKKDSHKGDRGRLLVIGGGPYTGAPALVGLGALRTGVDLVHIATPQNISNLVGSFSPNLIMHPLPQSNDYLTLADVEGILRLLEDISADAVVIGPGLGRINETLDGVIKIIEDIPERIPILLDADALTALASQGNTLTTLLKNHTGVLTPHRGEFQNILTASGYSKMAEVVEKKDKNQNPHENNTELTRLQRISKEFTSTLGSNWTVLLKGHIDIITDGRSVKLNKTGNPGMTVGGTGDVLAGITGALLAMGLNPYKAARCAAFINGYAGDLAWEKYRNGLTATDIIELIPQCFKDWLD